jgi:hypothetical protein
MRYGLIRALKRMGLVKHVSPIKSDSYHYVSTLLQIENAIQYPLISTVKA